MPERLILEEFHVTMTVSERMPCVQASDIRRILASRKFRAALRPAVQAIVREYPELRQVRVAITV